jgi:hypothetical protein
VPKSDDQNVYLAVDDLGQMVESIGADVEAADLETIILDLLEGQYKSSVRVVGFNTAEKWSQDFWTDVAHELRRRCDLQMGNVPFSYRTLLTSTKAAIET